MPHPLSVPLSDAAIEALRARNAARARQAIEQMGPRHALHPANRPQRLPQPIGTLRPHQENPQ